MKRLYNAVNAISVVIALSLVSCEQPFLDNFSKETEIILKAEFADSTPETRTTITDDSADPMPLSWLKGDAINVFFGNSESSIFTTAVSGRVAEFSGSINGVVGGVEGATQENFLWGVYPYSSKTTCDGSSVIYTLPSVQTAVAGTFADDLYPAIARSQNFYMSFYNVCGGFRFKVSNPDIVKVTLKGNKGEALAGKAKITMDEYPVVEEILEGSTELTMTAPDGGCFEVGKYYYFVAYPIEFSEGLTITYHKEDSQADYVVSNAHTLTRNKFSSFTNRDAGLTFVKTDELYIDEYGVNHGPGVEIDGVVWAPVNCGYHETDYPWGKLYQWGRKYGQGYDSNDASVPSIVRGPEDFYTVTEESNSNKFYTSMNLDFDWIYGGSKSYLWNSGTEENPIKTEYDPCPDGWRVPTYIELDALKANYSSLTTSNGQNGYWFSGSKSYSESVNSIFLSAAGERLCGDGSAGGRGNYGKYWSSSPYYNDTYCLKLGLNVLDYFHRASGFSVRCVKDSNALEEEDDIKVQKIYMLTESATLAPGTSYTLDTDYEPYNATNTTWKWSSSDASVAYVDASGKVTAIGDGEATITATATDGSGVSASSTISVVAITAVASAEYKDEYGVNHGRGIAIGDVVWAPVNCGYHETDYPYGKLYQWGRKYGQGYSLTYDSTAPSVEDGTIIEGPIKISEGQDEENGNIFYSVTSNPYDWALYTNEKLWNSGTEEDPKKTNNDPCPEGWRVPTRNELEILSENYSEWTSDDDKKGRWFNGIYTCQNNAHQIFLPASGYRNYDGDAGFRNIGDGSTYVRGSEGYYWGSVHAYYSGCCLRLTSTDVYMTSHATANGHSVRCVQE